MTTSSKTTAAIILLRCLQIGVAFCALPALFLVWFFTQWGMGAPEVTDVLRLQSKIIMGVSSFCIVGIAVGSIVLAEWGIRNLRK